jgi:hypothetical protein
MLINEGSFGTIGFSPGKNARPMTKYSKIKYMNFMINLQIDTFLTHECTSVRCKVLAEIKAESSQIRMPNLHITVLCPGPANNIAWSKCLHMVPN